MKNKIFIFVLFAVSPLFSQAEVFINEIAWQGYLGDANNEWIELYNEGSEAINLDGWLLEASDGAPSINLSSMSVNPSEYILLERTDDSTVPEETASKFYSGALSNEGENLVLKNSAGTVVDSANFSSGWGDMQSSSTGTLSRFGSSWREGEATPKSQNISLETDEEDTDENTDEDTNQDEDDQGGTVNSKSSSSSDEKVVVKPKGSIQAVKQSFIGVPILFESFLTDDDGSEIKKGIYAWNMGDGTILYKVKKEDFSYTYQYPGEYVVTLSFHRFTFGKDLSELEPYIYDEHIISIAEHSLTLEDFKIDGTMIFKNNSPETLDMSYWSVQSGDLIFTIPKSTIVRAGKMITFPGSVTRLRNPSITVKDAQGTIVSIVPKENKQTTSESNQSSPVEKSVEHKTKQVEETKELVETSAKNTVSLVSYSEQKTMYVGLFALLAVLISIIIWILFHSRKQSQEDVIGYEVIEE